MRAGRRRTRAFPEKGPVGTDQPVMNWVGWRVPAGAHVLQPSRLTGFTPKVAVMRVCRCGR